MALDAALADLLSRAAPLAATETLATVLADRRVLADDLVSALHVPPQDNSSMDGYAVCVADITEKGVVLPVSQRIPAGHAAQPLEPRTCARIFTGAPASRRIACSTPEASLRKSAPVSCLSST